MGVITGKEIPDKERIAALYQELNSAFTRETSKEEIVEIMRKYLPSFEHLETGKSLDSKM